MPFADKQQAVLWCNLGTPDAPTAPAVRTYLAEFLSDRRVVDLPRWLWLPILHGIVLRTRPEKSAAKYASVWMPEGSPLRHWTLTQADLLQRELAAQGLETRALPAMRYGQPSIAAALQSLANAGVRQVRVLPAYPQYSITTTASLHDAIDAWQARNPDGPSVEYVDSYHDDAGYIAALAERVQSHWHAGGRAEVLVMSFHGVPQRTVDRGDPYERQCHQTARLLAQRLGLEVRDYRVTFQSRFGKAKWLDPATDVTLRRLAADGIASVDVFCPGFVADCLETLEEIGMEGRALFLEAGGKEYRAIPCLNDSPAWIAALAALSIR